MLLNPYIAGNPLKDPAAFFGRDDIVREVTQMLNHPDEKAIVLFGQRRIGKTTILLQIDQRLTQEGNFTPIYFDLQDRASSTLPEVLYKLAQTIAHRIRMPIPSMGSFDENGNFFIKDFLPEAIKLSAPNGIVILFDEFDVMDSAQNNQAGRIFFPYLRAFISELVHVKFVFVIGRRPEELSTESLSTFKGIRASRVSLLDRKSTELVIRQSETKSNLFWTDDAIEQVWKYTQGHTYFTQLLCSVIWERVEENSTNKKSPTVLPRDVDDSIRDAFKQGANAFHWIWDGLPPAERVVMAAMAEVGEETISQEQIENVLNQSGVRLVARELKIAPMTLVEWDLLHPVEKNYQFAVPLLQQWVKNNRPLVRVKDELDRLDPLAENLYKSGQSFYGLGKTTEAIQLLRQALTANPNHLKSRLLLGRILLEQGTMDAINEAVQTLEDGYKYDTIAVGADLVRTLLAFADFQSGEDEKVKIYNRILEIQPNQSLAQEKLNNIWIARGELALQNKNFTAALAAFEKAGDLKKIEMVRLAEKERWQNDAELALQKNNLTNALELYKLLGDNTKITYVAKLVEKAWVDEQLKRALLAEKEESWEQASQIYDSILEKQPDNENIVSLAKNAKNQSNLYGLYEQAVQYLNAKHPENAKPLLVEILQIQPDYKDAARYLYEVVKGVHNARKETARLPMSLEDNARKQTARLPMSLEDIGKDNAPKQTLNLQKHLSDLGKTIVVTVLTILTGIFGFAVIGLVLSYITGGSGIAYLIALVPAVILMIAVGRRASYYFVNGSRNKL
jgi:tetratricopeptide (TPR) repeat protein